LDPLLNWPNEFDSHIGEIDINNIDDDDDDVLTFSFLLYCKKTMEYCDNNST